MRQQRLRLRVCAVLLGLSLIGGLGAGPAAAAVDHDEAERAAVISALPFSAQVATVDATAGAADPQLTGPACTTEAAATVWYRYTPAQSLPLRLATTGSDYDTIVAVFAQGTEGLEQVACNDTADGRRQARTTVDVVAGTTYLVMVGAAGATSPGTLDLVAEESPVPPLTVAVTVAPLATLDAATGELTLRGTVECSRPVLLWVSGTVQQDGSTTSVARPVDCPGQATWTTRTHDRQGPALHAGRAEVALLVQGGDEHDDAAVEVAQPLRIRGPRIAFARSVSTDGHDPFRTEIFTINEGGTGRKRLTRNNVEDNHPAFSPDGARIAFTSARRGPPSIYVMNADGSRVRRVTTGRTYDSHPAWSPDGKWIVFSRYDERRGQSELLRVRVADRATRRITRTPARELQPTWSPDGKLIAFTKLLDAKNRFGIAVIRPDGSGTRWLTRNPRPRAELVDEAPTWAPRGTHVAFARETTQRTSDIFSIRRRGTGLRRLTRTGAAQQPSWGTDGRMVLVHDGLLAVAAPDGADLRPVTGESAADGRPYVFPDWAPTVNR